MESVKEVLIMSMNGSKENNCVMHDFDTANVIEYYKEGTSGKHCVDFIGNDYLISAFDDNPRIKIWQIGQSSSVYRKMTCPGVVSALAVDKSGLYCVAGIGKKTYVWEIATGILQSILEYHLQDITCVKFTSDGSDFITGGKDGMVVAFFLTDVLIARDSAVDVPEPHRRWNNFISEITDIHVGSMDIYSRVVAISADMACRIYELETGNHLCTIYLNAQITAVTMDVCEFFLFLGTVEGNIYRINLFDMKEAEMHFEDIDKENVFSGHKSEITCLCVSFFAKYLVSGSTDKECRTWDITNFSCYRKITATGSVTNVMTCLLPPGIKNKKHTPRLITSDFRRVISNKDNEEPVPTKLSDQTLSLFHAGSPDQFFESEVLNCSTETLEKLMAQGTWTVDDLSRINNEMYSFALNDVFVKSNASEGSVKSDASEGSG